MLAAFLEAAKVLMTEQAIHLVDRFSLHRGPHQAPEHAVDLHMFARHAEYIIAVVGGPHLDLRAFAVILPKDGFFSLYCHDRTIAIAQI